MVNQFQSLGKTLRRGGVLFIFEQRLALSVDFFDAAMEGFVVFYTVAIVVDVTVGGGGSSGFGGGRPFRGVGFGGRDACRLVVAVAAAAAG